MFRNTICRDFYSTDWWSDLATLMPHVTWLSLCLGLEVDSYGETFAFALTNLPNLTYLRIEGINNPDTVNGLLRLPALQTLELDEDKKLHPHDWYTRMCGLKIECPSLVSLRFHIRVEISMSTS